MKPRLKRVLAVAGSVALAAGLAYGVMVISFTGDPVGKYASWEFYPHDPLDILRFEAGKVTLETCCGNEDQGTYSREPDGSWLWSWQRTISSSPDDPTAITKRHEFRIERRLFHLRIRSLRDTSIELDMRSRIFNGLPI